VNHALAVPVGWDIAEEAVSVPGVFGSTRSRLVVIAVAVAVFAVILVIAMLVSGGGGGVDPGGGY
jgi:hypothetical protein